MNSSILPLSFMVLCFLLLVFILRKLYLRGKIKNTDFLRIQPNHFIITESGWVLIIGRNQSNTMISDYINQCKKIIFKDFYAPK